MIKLSDEQLKMFRKYAVETDNTKVLKEYVGSNIFENYKVQLIEHIYDEESAKYLSANFRYSNTKELLGKKYWTILIYNYNISEPIYMQYAVDCGKLTTEANAEYEKAVAIIKLIRGYSLTQIKDEINKDLSYFGGN